MGGLKIWAGRTCTNVSDGATSLYERVHAGEIEARLESKCMKVFDKAKKLVGCIRVVDADEFPSKTRDSYEKLVENKQKPVSSANVCPQICTVILLVPDVL